MVSDGNREITKLHEDVLLLAEVSESSLDHDRKLKLPAYAEAGIRECWIVNMPEQHVEVSVSDARHAPRTGVAQRLSEMKRRQQEEVRGRGRTPVSCRRDRTG